jgi:hypothetical protein
VKLMGVITCARDRSRTAGEIVNSDRLNSGPIVVSVVLVPNASRPATADSSLSLNTAMAGCGCESVAGSSADQIGTSESASGSGCLPRSRSGFGGSGYVR